METGSASPRSRWLTAKEAADYVGIHVVTLYSYTKQRKNRPPFFKLGKDRRYRFPREEFIQWANGSTKGSANV